MLNLNTDNNNKKPPVKVKQKTPDEPPPLAPFFESILLEVKRSGYCVVPREIIAHYLLFNFALDAAYDPAAGIVVFHHREQP